MQQLAVITEAMLKALPKDVVIHAEKHGDTYLVRTKDVNWREKHLIAVIK